MCDSRKANFSMGALHEEEAEAPAEELYLEDCIAYSYEPKECSLIHPYRITHSPVTNHSFTRIESLIHP
eukprot:1181234-Prorocentrum_minimum.AAC.2